MKDELWEEWTELEIRLLRGDVDHLYSEADQEKIESGEAHVVDNPASCSNCFEWGEGMKVVQNGMCITCWEGYQDWLSNIGDLTEEVET